MTNALHVVPVGRSLLAKADDRSDLQPLRSALDPASFDDTLNPGRRVASELHRLAPDGVLRLDQVLSAEQRNTVRDADAMACAEWTSVTRVAYTATATGTSHLLIATDTDPGLRSAVLVAARWAKDTDQIRYVHDPEEARGQLVKPGEVWVVRVPHLDFERPIPDTTWYAVGSIGHIIQRTGCAAIDDRWEVTLHLTGGYKGMLPYLLAMGEGVQSFFRDCDEVTPGRVPTLEAVSIHEHKGDTPIAKQTLIELPIRWFTDLDSLRDLKEHTATSPGVSSPQWDDWCGQWITGSGRGARLSPTGMILTRVP